MIKHVVCFKLKDEEKDSVDEAVNVLKSMDGIVPQIKAIEVGADFLHSSRSYDIFLQVTLDNKKALNDYQNDPYHCDIVKIYIHEIIQSSIAIDYQI